MKNYLEKIKKPFRVLAPMAGYTDSAFRQLCKSMGADVLYTEMISADAIAYAKFSTEEIDGWIKVNSSNKTTAQLLSFKNTERPIVFQLFGKHPEKFAKAALWLTKNVMPDGIDINMGCPARKVVGSDHGAALLQNTSLACEIVKAVKDNTDCPVSVKTRLGWDSDDQIFKFAPELRRAGIDAIMIHGRTYKDGFRNQARWENIFEIKDIFGQDLVVIGNGDITSIFGDIVKLRNELELKISPLDGVAVGRAAFGKPWIFDSEYKVNENLKEVILSHARMVYEHKGEHGIIEFRKHLLAYFTGFPNAKESRKTAVGVEDYQEIERLVDKAL